MELEKLIKSLKYLPKIGTSIGYFLLLIASIFLFFGKKFPSLEIKPLLNILPDFYNHISNFTLSFLIYITVGYVGLMAGMKSKHLIIIEILFVLLNLIIEFFISILNTPDMIDAVYGIFGTIVGLIFLLIAKKYGFVKNEL